MPKACTTARKIVKYLVTFWIFLYPSCPSFRHSSNVGITEVRSCIIMEELMYGVILMAKSENLLRAPPENRSRNPKRFPDEKRLSKIDVSTSGTGICTPRRNTKNITIVKRMRSFNSLLAAKFAKADPISDHLYFST